MKRKFIQLAVLVITIMAMLSMGALAADTLTMSVSSETNAVAGETATLTISLSSNPGLAILGLGIEYDSEALELQSMAFDPSFSVGSNPSTNTDTKSMAIVFGSGDTSYTGTIATLTFKVLKAASSQVRVSITECTTFEEVGVPLTSASVTGTISVPSAPTPCDHSYTESVVKPEALKSAANCQSAAVYYKSCSACGAVSTSDTDTFTSGEKDANVHTGTLGDWLTDTENTKHWKEYSCCHAHASEAAHASTGTNAATCTKKAVCDDCGQSYGDKADHSYTAAVEKLEALKTAGDCLTEAVYYKSCSACGTVSTSDTDTFNGAKDPTTHAATCEEGDEWLTDEANTKHWKERTCGAKAEEAAHSSTGGNVATCQQVAICDDCGKDYGDKTAHGNWCDDYKVVTEPTCGKDGVAEGTCGYCQQMIKNIVLPATGKHTWDEGKVTKEATATAEGEKTYTCSVCGQTKTEAIAKLQPSGGKNAPKAGTPKTGDESHLVLWAVVLLAACGGGTALVIRSRKKEN